MLGHPKKFDAWLASGPIALGVFLVGLFGALWLPASIARWWVWLALLPALAVLGALLFMLLANFVGRIIR
jgi:hypothetical protein